MKSLLFIIFTAILNSSFANSLSCEQAQNLKLSDNEINQLTNKICTPDFGSDPDEYLKYDKKIQNLTAQQRLIYDYTYNCFETLNAEMRKTSSHNNDIFTLSQQLDIALCDNPTFVGTTYRGVNLPEDILKQYISSSEIQFPSFTSTSKKKHIGCQFAGNSFFKIHSKNGKEIIKQSQHENEEEVLFRLNSKFKVVAVFSGDQAQAMSECPGNQIKAFIELIEL